MHSSSSICSLDSLDDVPLYSTSPSGLSGIPWEHEQRQIRGLCAFVRETGLKLQLPPWTITTALLICQRFFQMHSLEDNDRFVIGLASLFLAGKIQNTAKSPLEVISNGWEIKSKGNRNEIAKLSHNNFLTDLRRHMIQAEELLLIAIDFDFDFPLPCSHAMRLLEEFKNHSHETRIRISGLTMKLLDHIMMGGFCVNFEAESLAAVAVSIACNILQVPIDRLKIWRHAEVERADELVDEVFTLYRETYLDSPVESKQKTNPFSTQNTIH